MDNVTFLFGHDSEQTALEVTGYPYGRLRTSKFYWIETVAKKGDRLCTYTINPKNGRKNAVKKSTFSNLGVLYRDNSNGHIHWTGVSIYTGVEKTRAFVERLGGPDKLNDLQKIMYKELAGINTPSKVQRAPIKGFDYSIKWGKDKEGKCDELTITFDRPDGVSVKEIFEAMRATNQERLNEVFAIRNYKFAGDAPGVVRIHVRGGLVIGTVSESQYKEYCSRDEVQAKIEIDA